MQARVRVLGEQEHRLLLRACRDVVAVLIAARAPEPSLRRGVHEDAHHS